MRYVDWDVLLFPGRGAEEPSQIPLREFRTTASAVRDRGLERCETTRREEAPLDGEICERLTVFAANSISPLVHCFVPSLADHAPFQISVHSWSTKRFHYRQTPASKDDLTQVWQIRVFVDGVCVCVETFGEDTTWPKVLAQANWSEERQVNIPSEPLRFPAFNPDVMQQRNWTAHDTEGRIKIVVSEGYTTIDPEKGDLIFQNLVNHAMLIFQPAPMNVLQNAGIAWPNAYMYANARYPDSPQLLSNTHGLAHTRNVSQSSFHSSPYVGRIGRVPGAPPPTPNMDDGSRSTSAYSNIAPSFLPLGSQQPSTYPNMKRPIQVRLPSDQLTSLVGAFKSSTGSMPPPLLPAPHTNSGEDQSERRVANASDISMHADYQSFPDCTSVDEQGHVVHVPAHAVRSKKEGSVDTSNRDFLSNILNPTGPASQMQSMQESTTAKRNTLSSSSPAGGERKRTRASLKALTVNDDGSPEKKDRREADQDEGDDEKPARKVSRASLSDKENLPMDDEMLLDV